MGACIDTAAAAKKEAAAATRGVTRIYSFDGGTVTTISHVGAGEQRSTEFAGTPPEFLRMQALGKDRRFTDLIALCDQQIKARPEWLTPYFLKAVALSDLNRKGEAIPLLQYVVDESAGSPEYEEATNLLKQLTRK